MFEREVRLGLVLYGGVSLAIYENGIVQEIYRALCGDSVYGLIRELIGSDIVVDIVSGTSAGGVNGIMLAYSLARGLDFLPSADLWREEGDIAKLLRKVDDKDDSSLLDSNYYQDRLASCFANTLQPPKDGRVPPSIEELDLFVTGTDANGVVSTVYDDLGHPIDVKNHRALFQLQYRGARKNDFQCGTVPTTADQMGTLSRLTSGFPVAFKPIQIGSKDEDPNFYRWGKLSSPAVYMDGGILNNKPFTSTIDAIASRTATREVERFLIYVEPSPEQFCKPVDPPLVPSVVQAGIRSLTSIPSYQSIAGDLEAIEAHNERALQVQKILEALDDQPAPDPGPGCLAAATALPSADDPCPVAAYITARLLLVKDAAVESILNNPDGSRHFFQPQESKAQGAAAPGKEDIDERRSGRLLVQSFWFWKGNPSKTLESYDVFFRRRRMDHLSRSLMRALKSDTNPLDVPPDAWHAVNHLFKLYEIAEWAMRKWLTSWPFKWRSLSATYADIDSLDVASRNKQLANISGDIWNGAEIRLDQLIACGIQPPGFEFRSPDALQKAREDYYEDLKAWIAANDQKAPDSTAAQPAASPTNLLLDIDNSLKQAITAVEGNQTTAAAGKLLRLEFCRFIDVDRQLLPIQIGSGFSSTDVVRVVRFSPLDAQRGYSKVPLAGKVRGATLANFGAFFKKGWRAMDIMTGRFDAVCLLTECLLTKERLTAMAPTFKPFTDAQVLKALPSASPGFAATINGYFATAAPTEAQWQNLIDGIVLAAHKQIAAEEWPRVLQCSLDQQYQWGQYTQQDAVPSQMLFPSRWTAAKSSPDELLMLVAENAIAQSILPPFQPPLPVRPFTEEVPTTALQEHVSQAWLRLGRSLLASIPPGSAHEAVESNLLFKATMQWVPGFFYRLVNTRRTQPDWVVVPMILLLNLALLGILIFAWMAEGNHRLSSNYAVAATAAVLAAVAIEWAFTRSRPRLVGIALFILIVLTAAFLQYHAMYFPVSHLHWLFAGKCLLSVVVITLFSLLPFKSVLAKILTAALAGAVLLFLIWW